MTSFLLLPTTVLLVVAELVVLLFLWSEVVPVHRRAGRLACSGMGLAACTAVGVLIAEVAAVVAFTMAGVSGGGGFGLGFLAVMALGTLVPPIAHGVGLAALGLAMLQLLRRLEGSEDEDWSQADGRS